SPGLVVVLAIPALFGGNDRHRQQVGQGAGRGGIAGRALAQGQVVLQGIVARRRVQPALGIGLARGGAQLVRAQRGQRVVRGRRLRLVRRRGGGLATPVPG